MRQGSNYRTFCGSGRSCAYVSMPYHNKPTRTPAQLLKSCAFRIHHHHHLHHHHLISSHLIPSQASLATLSSLPSFPGSVSLRRACVLRPHSVQSLPFLTFVLSVCALLVPVSAEGLASHIHHHHTWSSSSGVERRAKQQKYEPGCQCGARRGSNEKPEKTRPDRQTTTNEFEMQ